MPCEMARRRLTCKQRPPEGYASHRLAPSIQSSSSAGRRPSQAVPPKRPSQKSSPQGKNVRKVTALKQATRTGLVPKAARPFAVFCRETRQNASVAGPAWKALSKEEKMQYETMSRNEFAAQRQKSMEAGVGIRFRQVKGTDLAEAFPVKARNSFAIFLNDQNQSVKKGRKAWSKLSEAERESFSERAKSWNEKIKQQQASDSAGRTTADARSHISISVWWQKILACFHLFSASPGKVA